jgi:hypothetical protein
VVGGRFIVHNEGADVKFSTVLEQVDAFEEISRAVCDPSWVDSTI